MSKTTKILKVFTDRHTHVAHKVTSEQKAALAFFRDFAEIDSIEQWVADDGTTRISLIVSKTTLEVAQIVLPGK